MKKNKNVFNSIPVNRPRFNRFDLSHDVKLSFRMGELTPYLIMEVVPGDVVDLSTHGMIRLAPMVNPPMHEIDIFYHNWFVPNRILWDKWEDYITQTKDPITGLLPVHPFFSFDAGGSKQTRLSDYLGVPIVEQSPGIEPENINAFPFAAYQKIYNDCYRDQNLISEVLWELVDGDNGTSYAGEMGEIRRRAWEHDFFTSALPFAQKGEEVVIPLGEFNDVPVKNQMGVSTTILDGTPVDVAVNDDDPNIPIPFDSLFAKTSTLTFLAATINNLRKAFGIQRYLEKAARGGTRYIEWLKVIFGVKSSDARLQRPEYIGGSKGKIMISEVLSTVETDDAPQGSMAGHGLSVASGKQGHFRAEEHGFIIGIISCRPRTAYQQGLAKHWLKISDPFEYFIPDLANVGEEPISNREVMAFQGSVAGSETFGYVPRYTDMRYIPSRVAGQFRTTLASWHLGRIFDATVPPPALNEEFISCTPSKRIFAVTDPDQDELWAHIFNQVSAARPIPLFGNPI